MKIWKEKEKRGSSYSTKALLLQKPPLGTALTNLALSSQVGRCKQVADADKSGRRKRKLLQHGFQVRRAELEGIQDFSISVRLKGIQVPK